MVSVDSCDSGSDVCDFYLDLDDLGYALCASYCILEICCEASCDFSRIPNDSGEDLWNFLWMFVIMDRILAVSHGFW